MQLLNGNEVITPTKDDAALAAETLDQCRLFEIAFRLRGRESDI